jgi:hypothetical protein
MRIKPVLHPTRTQQQTQDGGVLNNHNGQSPSAKTFRAELLRFHKKIVKHEPFALVRYGDGELGILKNERINDFEYKNDPADASYLQPRANLLDSLRYQHPHYYVGMSCPHCVGEEQFQWLKMTANQGEENLTFACLFVNSNYRYYLNTVVPLYQEYKIALVCHRSASTKALPFKVHKDFRVTRNAWRSNHSLIGQMRAYIERENARGMLFLLCAGPFSCILAHQLHAFCEDNTYLDIGSTLDPYLFGASGLTRGYLQENADLRDVCYWK